MAGEQAEQLGVCTGGSGVLRVCCFSFLTKRLVLASVEFLGSGGRYKVRAGKVQVPPGLQAKDTRALSSQGAETSRPPVGIAESGPEI